MRCLFMLKGLKIMAEQISAIEYIKKLKASNGKEKQDYGELEMHLDFRAREKGIPISGKFELTPLCNFNCKMCYVHLNADQLSQSVLPVETWKDLIHQAWNAGMINARLTGGECLAYPGFEELFLYLHSLGCTVNVLTNGFLLDENRIQFFKDHKPALMQITLYGPSDDVYERVTGKRAFTTVVNNFKKAKEAGLPVFLAITPNKYLGEDIFETIRVAKELTSDVVINNSFTTPREETGRSKQQDDADLDLYIQAMKLCHQLDGFEIRENDDAILPPCGGPCHETSKCGLTCGGGRSTFAIDWKGTMVPCTDLPQICAYPLKDGFAAAWSKVNQEANNWPRVPECEGCPYDDVCFNCAANVLRYAELGKQPLALCEKTKAFVRNGVNQITKCEQ